jgi:Mg-chelatase subunit ChlD
MPYQKSPPPAPRPAAPAYAPPADSTVRESGEWPPPTLAPTPSAEAPAVDASRLARSITRRSEGVGRLEELYRKRRADIMFVLDCTGSMKGEIDAIRDAIIGFVDSIQSEGVRARVGLIEFRDRLIDEEHRALLFDGQPFTSDPAAFRREVSVLRAGGGGDEPESSLDAILLALRQPYEEGANKVIVLVTDAPPHIPDREARSMEEVAAAVAAANVQQFYLVIRTQEPQSQVYLKLFEGTGTRGLAFELGKGGDFRSRAEDFKRTLMSLGKTISSATR